MMKNHTVKPSHILTKKKQIALNESELFCKKYCTDTLLESLHFSYREIVILKLRWNEFKSFEEIAYEICVSQERARVIYRKNIMKIIAVLKNDEKQKSDATIIDTSEISPQMDTATAFKTKWINILHEKNIFTMQDLANHNYEDLLRIKSFGKHTIDLMETILKQNGFEFAK